MHTHAHAHAHTLTGVCVCVQAGRCAHAHVHVHVAVRVCLLVACSDREASGVPTHTHLRTEFSRLADKGSAVQGKSEHPSLDKIRYLIYLI